MFSYAKQQWELGTTIYRSPGWQEKKRTLVFVLRALKYKSQMKQLEEFFDSYTAYPNLLKEQEGIWEVVTRVFLYKNSTAAERTDAIIHHFSMLPQYFTTDAIHRMYTNAEDGVTLWKSEELELDATLYFIPGQRKEGLLTLLLRYQGHGLYHMNLRFGKDHQGNSCIWVGTIQGYKDGLERAKKLTKKMHGYRPKNFIFFLLRQLATNMGIEHIYAVSDEGFFSNSHALRFHRHKLVTFNEFWEELGGQVWSEDARFFTIPIEEERKTYETAKTHKRNMYRKRYEMLDTFIEEIQHQGKSFLCDR